MDKNKKKKILLATGIYPPDIGGPATYVAVLEKELPKFGFDVNVITYGDEKQELKNQNLFIISRKQNLFLKYFKYFLGVWMLRKKIDVVYCFDQVSSGLPCAISKLFNKKKKLIIRLGGDFLWEKAYEKGWTDKILKEYYNEPKNLIEKIYILIYKFVFSQCDKIIFSTKWQKEIILKNFNINDNKCLIINNTFPDVKNYELVFKNNFKNKQLLFAGRLIKVKNIERLLNAIKNINEINLKIIGNGPSENKLKKLTNNLNLSSRVNFQKGVSREDLFKIMKKSFLMVVPMISEISPNTVLEAIKLKVPVIVTKECGFYENFKDKVIFFNPLDKNDIMEKIQYLMNENNYNKYCEKLKNFNINRSWNDVVREHVKFFNVL